MVLLQIHRANRQAGFTLLELLVVLAIILILAALLTSGLVSARQKARDLQCLSNERHLAMSYKSMRSDNSDFKLKAWKVENLGVGKEWLCPYASKTNENAKSIQPPFPCAGRVDRAWWYFYTRSKRRPMGSYGINSWMRSEKFTHRDEFGNGHNNDFLFRNESEITDPVRTPFFFDCIDPGALVETSEEPPPDPVNGGKRNLGMDSIAVPRHGTLRQVRQWDVKKPLPGINNVCFFDGHAERVRLDNLWQLSWHRDYVIPLKRPGSAP
jgi:prepilin-type N-terminal cleavage/methylation domain-containing protein/prepilin-type processing-associated H-X9-DG protein